MDDISSAKPFILVKNSTAVLDPLLVVARAMQVLITRARD
jgi:hypothetical protein